MSELTAEQREAVERRGGSLLVRAGAGTGKTTVLVERFVQAVLAGEAAVDGILAITFTDKAAAEMRARVRRRFLELGRREEAREAERAWISTIHGFCARVLRAHALTAGLDPDFRVLDAPEADRVGLDAFDRALEEFLLEADDPVRLEVVASYSPDRLREMVRTVYGRRRSAGQRVPDLEPTQPPAPRAERERLAAAASAALRHLGGCEQGKAVLAAIERLERCGRLVDRLADGRLAVPDDLKGLALTGNAGALRAPECDAYAEALTAYSRLCSEHREHRDQTLLRELLCLYGRHFEGLKRERSGLDFEDLELIARDLLHEHAGIRASYAERFAQVLVDEFQDTNRLQNSLLELLERDNLFRVGDEHQSIYAFRNADVEVFREYHAAASASGRAQSVTINFRSRREVLDAIDLAFHGLWGERYEPLRAPEAAAGRAARGPCVEVLVADRDKGRWDARFGEEEEPFGPGMRGVTPWRACEARLVAKRIDELTHGGGWAHRDVVVLLRATTHMGAYERALEERGVPTHVVGGRGYWSQQQVTDLRHWLTALANPLDELAFYSVLGSPLVGASVDALATIALRARELGRDPWWALRDGDAVMLESLPPADRDRVAAFVRLFAAEREAAPRLSLESLIDRAVTLTGYDRRILAMPAGERRLANVRKLMRLARRYEREEGRDLRGFIDFLGDRELVQEREGEAPLEAEHVDAVRLMTVHRAKGLEFPVVVLADLGKEGRDDQGSLRISNDGQLGLRLASLSGGAVTTERLERIRDEQRLAAEEEEQRVFYVAMTRAQQHLVLSGALDLGRPRAPEPLAEPMRWIAQHLLGGAPREGHEGVVAAGTWDGRAVPVSWRRCAPDTLDDLLGAADLAPVRPERPPPPASGTPPLELGAIPAPKALPVARLSYSALEDYRRCGYRFYLERALRLPAVEPPDADPREPGLPALLRGSVVHELLERIDFRRPEVPAHSDVEATVVRLGGVATAEEIGEMRDLVQGFLGSPLQARIAAARRVRTELPFVFGLPAAGRQLLVNGVVDVHATEEAGVLVVDYKTDSLEGADPAAVCDEKYAAQRLLYALAVLKSGAPRVEVAHVFLERADEPVYAVYTAEDAARLEGGLLDMAAGVVSGRFEPTDAPHRGLCADCPGRAALCVWGPERTLADPTTVASAPAP